MTAHIHVITAHGERLRSKHLIHPLIDTWKDQGHHVTVGPTRRLEADLGILHIDRTWVQPSCVPANPLQRPLLNAGLLDISKRRISQNLLSRRSGYTGPVIIKTDANYFGRTDRDASSHGRPGRLRRRLVEKGYWNLARTLPPRDYPVFDDISAVPGWIWKRDDLVVERFLPERHGQEYALRVWMFLGNHEYGVRLFSRSPIVKTENITRFDYLHDVPDYLREVRADLGVDYGKFDYVVADGQPVLLDVNKTPSVVRSTPRTSNLLHVAAGLSDFLG